MGQSAQIKTEDEVDKYCCDQQDAEKIMLDNC